MKDDFDRSYMSVDNASFKDKSAKNKSVCFLVEDFYPVVHGATTQIMLIGERLARAGFHSTLITRKINPEHPGEEQIRGINVIRVKPAVGLHRTGKYLMIIPAFLALLRERKKYDVIIVSDFKVLGFLGVIAAKFLGKQCFLRAESCGEMDGSFAMQFGNQPSSLKSLVLNILVKIRNIILMNSDGFLSISSVITKEFLKAGVPEENIVEITNGVDVTLFTPVDQKTKTSLRKKLGLPVDRQFFLYTGRLTEGKGLEYIMRAWECLVQDYDSIHLIFIGSGQGYSLDCEDKLKTMVSANNLDSTVTFTGNVHNVHEYLQAGNFYLLPSKTESFSISLVEALSCGLACIATGVGGILDYMNHNYNGIVIRYGNEDDLIDAMREVLENKEKAVHLGREGRKTVLERFKIDMLVEKYLLLFN